MTEFLDIRLMMEPKAATWAAKSGSQSALDEIVRAHLKLPYRESIKVNINLLDGDVVAIARMSANDATV